MARTEPIAEVLTQEQGKPISEGKGRGEGCGGCPAVLWT